jgi:hypothetical protein
MKDVWPVLERERSNAAFERVCRPPIMIPLDFSQEDILRAFRTGHGQLGIVRDIGTFEQTARFDAHLDAQGISLSLHRTGDADVRKSVHMHFHYALFAEILRDFARTVSALPPADAAHRDALWEGAKALAAALR